MKNLNDLKTDMYGATNTVKEGLDRVIESSLEYSHQVGYIKALKELFKIVMETDIDRTKLAYIIQQSIKVIDPEWESPYEEAPVQVKPEDFPDHFNPEVEESNESVGDEESNPDNPK